MALLNYLALSTLHTEINVLYLSISHSQQLYKRLLRLSPLATIGRLRLREVGRREGFVSLGRLGHRSHC